MALDPLASFFEAFGYDVVDSGSHYWYSASPNIYQSLPLSEPVSPTRAELDKLLSNGPMLGVQFPTLLATGVPVGRFVVRDKEYSLQSLQSQFRQHVRRGLERCDVRAISFEELENLGMPANLDSMKRREYTLACFSDPDLWSKYCAAGKSTEEAGVIGSFVNKDLAAYLVYIVIGHTCYGLHMMSQSDLRPYKPNHCLYFRFAYDAIQRPDVKMVTTGLHSLQRPRGIDDFKRHAGFELEACNVAAVLKPNARRLLANPISLAGLGVASRVLKKPSVLRIREVAEIASKTTVN